MKVAIDSLVEGPVGSTARVERMRVTRVMSTGHVSGINSEGGQRIMNVGNYQVVGDPRPEKLRRDIPEKLR